MSGKPARGPETNWIPTGGWKSRPHVSNTFLQPFLSYTTPQGVVVHAADESAYDWRGEQWSVPVHALASKVLKVGDQTLSVGGAARYWAEGPDSGPHGWGLRFFVTLLFPK